MLYVTINYLESVAADLIGVADKYPFVSLPLMFWWFGRVCIGSINAATRARSVVDVIGNVLAILARTPIVFMFLAGQLAALASYCVWFALFGLSVSVIGAVARRIEKRRNPIAHAFGEVRRIVG